MTKYNRTRLHSISKGGDGKEMEYDLQMQSIYARLFGHLAAAAYHSTVAGLVNHYQTLKDIHIIKIFSAM